MLLTTCRAELRTQIAATEATKALFYRKIGKDVRVPA
jgi:hypothetical protein